MLKLNLFDYSACFSPLLKTDDVATWMEYAPFGMFMVEILRPAVIVELGTQRGGLYLAFCQMVKQLGLEVRCYAINVWQSGSHSEYVLNDLRAYHDPLYGNFSRLIQGTFDSTVQYFPDGSIDLLHFDGSSTYETVRHDFETWLPKLSKHAVVLFHNTNFHEADFGVWQFWAELRQRYPTFEFVHGYGLGVLRLEPDPASALDALFALNEAETAQVRTFFSMLGSYMFKLADDQKRITEKDRYIKELEALCKEKERLTRVLADQKEAEIRQILAQKNNIEKELHEILVSKAWKFAKLLRNLRYVFIPANSWQERFARSFYQTLLGKK